MKAELTQQEIESISKELAKEMYKISRNEGAYAEIDRMSEAYTKRILEHYNPIINAKIDSEKFLAPIVMSIIEKNGLLEKIIKPMVYEVFNSDNFKKISIDLLRRRIERLEEELEKGYEED